MRFELSDYHSWVHQTNVKSKDPILELENRASLLVYCPDCKAPPTVECRNKSGLLSCFNRRKIVIGFNPMNLFKKIPETAAQYLAIFVPCGYCNAWPTKKCTSIQGREQKAHRCRVKKVQKFLTTGVLK